MVAMTDVTTPDVLDRLAGMHPADRQQLVAEVVVRVWETPAVLLREISPAYALAAVAVVAAGVRSSYGRVWRDDRLAAAALPRVSAELAGRALSALDVIVGRDRESVPLQMHVSDGDAARELLDDLRDVLMDGIRHGA